MSGHSDETIRQGPSANWGQPATPAPPASAIRHAYPLTVRNADFSTAVGLMLRSLPYAFARFGVLLAASVLALVWIAVAFGGAAFLGTHLASVFGWIWLILCLLGASFIWGTLLRYALHLISCGHVVVLTDLITTGTVGNGSEPMFAYGRRIVTARFGEATVLFGLNALVRGIVVAFHRTLDWISELLPIPGLEAISSLVNMILRAATRYLDKVIFSYNLARADADPWRSSRDGLIYYAQNARPVLKTAIWSVILERVASFVLFLLLMAPAGLLTAALPASARELGGLLTVAVALLLLGPLRAAFVKPIFLIMMMVRFHTVIEGQPINTEWEARLSAISDRFRDFGRDAAAASGKSRFDFARWR
jgi:hypothetical protein